MSIKKIYKLRNENKECNNKYSKEKEKKYERKKHKKGGRDENK
jgi:hypothetical protein